MSMDGLTHHISSRYNDELERLRRSVLGMGELVERQLTQAIGGISQPDEDVILKVAQDELHVNQLERDIDEDCNRILATRGPTASDLRLIITILKTITDLERIGDEAEKIAAISANLAARERPRSRYRELRNMGELVLEMVHAMLDAFARMDTDRALEVLRRDRLVDEEYEGIQRQSITFMMEDPRSIRRALDVMWVVRSLERIGDHAKNISEYLIYLVHGKDVRHTRIEDIENELLAARAALSRPTPAAALGAVAAPLPGAAATAAAGPPVLPGAGERASGSAALGVASPPLGLAGSAGSLAAKAARAD
jgi:phosphate transport system protein